jgi:hypothetical protein
MAYSIEQLNRAELPPEELHDEVAWGTIRAMGWIASPELFFALKAYVQEIGLIESEKSNEDCPPGLDP